MRGRERIPGVPVASQEEALSTGKARGPLYLEANWIQDHRHTPILQGKPNCAHDLDHILNIPK